MGSTKQRGGLGSLMHPAALGQLTTAGLHKLGAYGKTSRSGSTGKRRKSSSGGASKKKRSSGTRASSGKRKSKSAQLVKGSAAAKSRMKKLRGMRKKK